MLQLCHIKDLRENTLKDKQTKCVIGFKESYNVWWLIFYFKYTL